MNSYILITPAKNESLFIEETIKAVIKQTILPKRWIIVDDGSYDDTNEIVMRYSEKYNFIRLLQLKNQENRNFASKAHAFNAGYEELKYLKFNYIGNLDADITMDNNYYELILKQFYSDNNLGLAGGTFYDVYDDKKIKINNSEDSVRGAVQLFRRKCFSDIGAAYLPLEKGGIDSVAEYSAKLHGWKVKTFRDIIALHHRKTGSEGNSDLSIYYKYGKKEYSLGYHPIYELLRITFKLFDTSSKPLILSGLVRLYGYFYSFFSREKIALEKELVDFIRENQMNKIKLFRK